MRKNLSLRILVGLICVLGMSLSLSAQQAAAPVTTVNYSGSFVVNFTITVKSTIAATKNIACTVSALVLDSGSGNTITEIAGNAVVRGSGSTVACTATLPYSWNLATGTIDKINLSYSVQEPAAITSAAQAYPNRTSSQSLGTMSVPTTGTTTTINVSSTI